MIEIIYLGTCSGTEPVAGMHHCSLIFRVNGTNYWFDAGENCSYFAHVSGIDALMTKAVFVSHPHIDHIGGLANLLSVIRKLVKVQERTVGQDNTLRVYFPDAGVFDAVRTVLCGKTVNRELNYTLDDFEIKDGVIFEDENLRVTAMHNRHLGEDGSAGWHSYSFLIEAEGKRMIFSGDVKSPLELDGLDARGADLLIMETGHHKMADVLDFAESRGVKRLRFNHHGREILADLEEARTRAAEFAARSGIDTVICYDGMTENIK